ncbi:MAG: NUDIX hydrolase [Pyrobaculum sp.]
MDEIIYRGRKFTLVKRARRVGDRSVWGEYLVHPGAVAILALLGDRAILVKQFRPALGQWTLEMPAGTLEAGEDPQEAAVREMVEETGYKPLQLSHMLDIYPAPGVSNELVRIYFTNQLEHVGVGERDPGEEDMELALLSPREVLELIDKGAIKDGKTIAAFLFADRKALF